MKLAELARVLGATCHGDPDQEITGVEGIEKAGPGQVTFVANPKYTPFARTTRASAVLVTEDFPPIEAATLRTANPYLAFAHAIEVFKPAPLYPAGIHPTAVIDPSARVGDHAHIGAYVVIGAEVMIGPGATLLPHVVIYPNAKIGKDFFAHAHAVVREGCRLGDGVILQNGAVVGSDGFGFAKEDGGTWHKITQTGAVTLGDRVEVQANSCIDRASVGNTEIASGVKIDNLVQIGHGSIVGDNTLVCAQVGLAGSSGVGKNVVLAGQVGVVGHSFIGDGVIVTAQSGVPGDVAPGSVISGSPAFEHRQWMRSVAAFRRLPDLVKQINKKT
jgi:UDP-3-O-[3-hydroxymyristoyl] glucosamine N-acyltransferase